MKFSDSVLIESKTARDQGISEIELRSSECQILESAKSAFFAAWSGSGYMTTKQVAEYYSTPSRPVPENTIRQVYVRCKSEFDADGVIKLAGKELQDARDILSLASKTSQATLFPPRAVLRMGFVLTESDVAAAVRTAALNLIQGAGHHFSSEVLEALIVGNPVLRLCSANRKRLTVSAPLSPYYDSIERFLKSRYPDGGIPGLNKEEIRKNLAALSTCTDNWKLDTQKELRYTLHDSVCVKCPDLTSGIVNLNIDGQSKKGVLMFQISDLLVDERDVEAAVGRQYIKRAKEHFDVDYAFLFLIAPFGATPRAEDYILRELPEEMRGFVGVMTVKEVAQLLCDQARKERVKNLGKGEIKRNFNQVLSYEIPTDPLFLMMGC